MGGGNSEGVGGGALAPLATPALGVTVFNGTGGGIANGYAGGFVGAIPPTPDFTFIPLGP
jgi:hypothetical protein